MNTFTFGHPNALIPIWFYPGGILLHNAFTSPYLYDTDRFRKVLDKTINFESLTRKEAENSNDVVVADDMLVVIPLAMIIIILLLIHYLD